jgi:hypothetical protein
MDVYRVIGSLRTQVVKSSSILKSSCRRSVMHEREDNLPGSSPTPSPPSVSCPCLVEFLRPVLPLRLRKVGNMSSSILHSPGHSAIMPMIPANRSLSLSEASCSCSGSSSATPFPVVMPDVGARARAKLTTTGLLPAILRPPAALREGRLGFSPNHHTRVATCPTYSSSRV